MMNTPSNDRSQFRTYYISDCAVFRKTKEQNGGLSNMAAGYPLRVNDVDILTSEALYQACRFPRMPHVQKLIIGQASPMSAKMKSKPHRPDSRPDWDNVRVKIMRWCLRVKLAQNWEKFGNLLLSTNDKPIVEYSRRDDFWGAKPVDETTLKGINVLGRLLMELREMLKESDTERLKIVEPLNIPDFLFLDRPIEKIVCLTQTHVLQTEQSEKEELSQLVAEKDITEVQVDNVHANVDDVSNAEENMHADPEQIEQLHLDM